MHQNKQETESFVTAVLGIAVALPIAITIKMIHAGMCLHSFFSTSKPQVQEKKGSRRFWGGLED